jgi:hypothetical protein
MRKKIIVAAMAALGLLGIAGVASADECYHGDAYNQGYYNQGYYNQQAYVPPVTYYTPPVQTYVPPAPYYRPVYRAPIVRVYRPWNRYHRGLSVRRCAPYSVVRSPLRKTDNG